MKTRKTKFQDSEEEEHESSSSSEEVGNRFFFYFLFLKYKFLKKEIWLIKKISNKFWVAGGGDRAGACRCDIRGFAEGTL